MRNHSRIARIAGLFAATLGVAVGVAGVGVSSAQATVCTFEVLSVTSRELQDGDGQDEIKFDLGDDTYGAFTFPVNWTRNASLGRPRENFNSLLRLDLYDVDAVTRQTIDSLVVACWVGDHEAELSGNGAIYEIDYRITD